jgi:hypothetical protein
MRKTKRREFIKNASLAAFAISTTPLLSFNSSDRNNMEAFSLQESLILKGYNDEQEEVTSLVTNGKGKMWMFSLRRISYPENAELISAFYYNGKKWSEADPVTKSTGQYEAPAASCAPNGKPVVAWAEIKGKDWIIRASQMKENGFARPHTFPVKKGKSINPVLIAPNKNRNWIAWENLSNGVFTIYISKYENGQWSDPVIIDKGKNSCFDPAIAEAKNGDLYIVYGLTNGFHQDIEMTILNGHTLNVKKTIPVAIGGGRKNRVNINARPALAFDKHDQLWISYENNRNSSRVEDGDNYTGDRCCAILSYHNDKVVEIKDKGKWLFNGDNDHKPTFIKDEQGNLFLATHCGGNFDNTGWKYRFSWLDPQNGWQQPEILFETDIKGLMIYPAIAFENKNNFWLATNNEKFFNNYKKVQAEGITRSRLSELNVMRFSAPQLSKKHKPPVFAETQVKEFLPDQHSISTLSGHPRTERRQRTVDGETYTLLYGNLHEHSNSSNCWPAGTDGSLHDDYRFGMFTEAYDFFGMTDHAASTSEIHWRKNIRIADFYNESEKFVAIPAIEWTLQSDPHIDGIQYGAGHYNIIFASTNDAQKFIRNKHEIFCPRTPETKIAPMLWKLLDEKKIKCVTIPHHSADKVHPVDWNVTDPKYVRTVEIFQCRGNNEYPGCPREKNLSRHTTTKYKRAFIDYALRTKKYKMGFIASGDHNSMGIGVAALWVKEVNRAGIIEALQSSRTFATTGDKMFIDLKINGTEMGQTSRSNKTPELEIDVHGQYPLDKVEILRNSKVIHSFPLSENTLDFKQTFTDPDFKDENDVLYYYVRATQKNKALAWSSPVWIERS